MRPTVTPTQESTRLLSTSHSTIR